MKKFCLVSSVMTLLAFAACTGTHHQSTPVIKKSLVQLNYMADTLSAIRIDRDAAGRITRLETGEEINLLRYSGDSIMLSEFSKSAGREVYHFSGSLNERGAIVSGVAISNYGYADADTNMHQFAYNDAGYLLRETRTDVKHNCFEVIYEYDEQDAVRITTSFNKQLTNTKELVYYTNLDNRTGLEDYKFRRNCNGLAGNMSAHLVKKIRSTAGSGRLNYDFTYEYETDTDGLPVKAISKAGSKVASVTTFQYLAQR